MTVREYLMTGLSKSQLLSTTSTGRLLSYECLGGGETGDKQVV
jgi:hypothetical protein